MHLLNSEHNPDVMLLAARALTFLADVMPSSCSSIVRHGAVPAFCARLLTIEYIDLAEQSLQVRPVLPVASNFVKLLRALCIIECSIATLFRSSLVLPCATGSRRIAQNLMENFTLLFFHFFNPSVHQHDGKQRACALPKDNPSASTKDFVNGPHDVR